MEITIKEKTYNVKYGFRALMIYENIVGESFQPSGLNSLLTLFYSTIMAADSEASLDFMEFVDELDEQPEKLEEFSTYIVSMITKNNKISEKDTEPKKKVTKTKKM